MAQNPLDREVEELRIKLDTATAQLASDTRDLAAWKSEVGRYAGLLAQGEAWAAAYLPTAEQRVREFTAKVDAGTTLVRRLTDQYEEKTRAQRAINDAAAANIANGFSPADAFKLAADKVQSAADRKKFITYAAIAIAVLVLGYVIYRFAKR